MGWQEVQDDRSALDRYYFWRLALLFLATCSSRSAITSGIINVFKAEHKAGGPPDKKKLQSRDE